MGWQRWKESEQWSEEVCVAEAKRVECWRRRYMDSQDKYHAQRNVVK